MKLSQDLTNCRLGRLTIMHPAARLDDGRARWLCTCDCGNESIAKQQTSNTRRNINIEVRGEKMTLMQAVEKYGGRYGKVLDRIHAGWPPEKALGL